ncbi:ABC transporter ATP-binding protein [Vulcanisaeta souniana]|nr:ABC transporter ATP-binding protein [Vulcanisaeta souniana]BDR92423.1 ABC transporter ATP-binding protein [Vulcanisaeta souniana JCM 11219]
MYFKEVPFPFVVSFIEARDVWKYYGDYPALRGVNIEIKEGEFRCIIGPSGSGKTTLLSLIGGLDRVSRGYLRVGPYELHKLSNTELDRYRNEFLGFVFQLYYLIPRMTVLENVELPLIARGVDPGRRRKLALEALEMVGLRNKARRRPNELSGGEQQRVAIARAIVSRPRLLLADEPTGNLDSKTAAVIMDIFSKLNRELGMTIVMVTHNLEIIGNCHRVSRISDGVITRTYDVPQTHETLDTLIRELMTTV